MQAIGRVCRKKKVMNPIVANNIADLMTAASILLSIMSQIILHSSSFSSSQVVIPLYPL